ncbi:transmembrane protein 47-like [Pseudonaja textilis]|uniref:transmembrane protein 47-like n=1 Tax=Pseudonaja textilis TaxID=8673 RepID=UPI000EA9DA67|nr:transmembrane protein 47-like [Pseudonaja textilis]
MSAAEERGLTVRPFKLIALLCAFLALALDVAALLSPAWVTSERYSLSLWKECRQLLGGWECFSPLGSGCMSLLYFLQRAFIISPS